MTTTLKPGDTVDIDALEWFDKINGNSYFSVRIRINGDEVDRRLAFGYGYGDAYRYDSLRLLEILGYVTNDETYQGLREAGVKVHASIHNALKREVVRHGGEA